MNIKLIPLILLITLVFPITVANAPPPSEKINHDLTIQIADVYSYYDDDKIRIVAIMEEKPETTHMKFVMGMVMKLDYTLKILNTQ